MKGRRRRTSPNVAASEKGVTEAGLKELPDLQELTALHLDDTGVTDAGLKELADLKQLTSLNLGDTDVSDAGLKELKHLKQLTTLDLSGTMQATAERLKAEQNQKHPPPGSRDATTSESPKQWTAASRT